MRKSKLLKIELPDVQIGSKEEDGERVGLPELQYKRTC